jgi:hypothetical protein
LHRERVEVFVAEHDHRQGQGRDSFQRIGQARLSVAKRRKRVGLGPGEMPMARPPRRGYASSCR